MFWVMITLVEALCVLALTLVGIWIGHYLGGVAWDGSTHEFNLHPIMMTLGFLVLNANALLMYRMFRNSPKMPVKIAHMVLQTLAMVCVCVGLKTVFDYHNANGIRNMYSIHSWVGITVFILFGAQWVCGFGIFLWPGARLGDRNTYKPIHVFYGVFVFAAACATMLIGIQDKLFLSLSTSYSSLPSMAYVANFFGYTILVLAASVTFTVTYEPWKRLEETEELQPLVGSQMSMTNTDQSNQP